MTITDDDVAPNLPATLEFYRVVTSRLAPCLPCGGTGDILPDGPEELVIPDDERNYDDEDDPTMPLRPCAVCRGRGRVVARIVPYEEVTERVPATVVDVDRDDEGRLTRVVVRDERPGTSGHLPSVRERAHQPFFDSLVRGIGVSRIASEMALQQQRISPPLITPPKPAPEYEMRWTLQRPHQRASGLSVDPIHLAPIDWTAWSTRGPQRWPPPVVAAPMSTDQLPYGATLMFVDLRFLSDRYPRVIFGERRSVDIADAKQTPAST